MTLKSRGNDKGPDAGRATSLPRGAPSRTTAPVDITIRLIDEAGKTIRTAVRIAGLCFCALVVFWIVQSLSGRTTSLLVRVALGALLDVRFALLVGGTAAAAVWGLLERRLRQRTILRLHGRIKQLETRIDPGRTTSNITPRGDTNPMDLNHDH